VSHDDLPGEVQEILLDLTDMRQISTAADQVREHARDTPLRAVLNKAGGAVTGPFEYPSIDEMRLHSDSSP
jgi:hypothetical protein